MRVVNLLSWDISTKLWLGCGFLILVLALCTIIAPILIHQADNNLNEAVDVQAPLEQAALQMRISASDTAQAVLDYARDRDPANIAAAHDAEDTFKTTVARFIDLAANEEVRQHGQELAQMYGKLTRSPDEILRLADQQHNGIQSSTRDIEAVGILVDDKLLKVIDTTAPDAAGKIKGALGMELAVLKTSNALEAYVAKPDPALQQTLLEAQANFKSSAGLYRGTSLSSYEESWLSETEKNFAAAVNGGNEAIATADSLRILLAKFKQDNAAIMAYITDQIEPLMRGEAARASDDSRSAMTAAIISILILGILGIIAGSASAWTIYRRFKKSVQGLQTGAQMVADGKLEHRFDVDTKDEFGQIGFSLNKMLQNLKRSREALGQSEETAWALLDATTDSLILTDIKGVILASNEAAAKRFGKSLEQIIDESFYDLLPADLMASRKAQIAEVIRSKKPLRFEEERGGMVLDTRIFPVFNEKGFISRIAIFASDITTRKWVEDVTTQLARRNELILEAAGEGIYGLDTEGKTTFVNPAAARMLGYKPEDLIGQRHHELVHHSKSNGMPYPYQQCPIYAAFKDGAIHHSVGDEVFWRKDGTFFHVDYTSTPIFEDGKIIGAVVTFQNITDRKMVHDALRQSEEKYRSIFENAANLIISVDKEGFIIDCSSRAKQVLGYKPDELISHNLAEIIHPDHRIKAQECLKEVLTKGFEYNNQYKMIQKDGTTIEVNMNAAAAKDAQGEYIRTICMIDRVANQKQA